MRANEAIFLCIPSPTLVMQETANKYGRKKQCFTFDIRQVRRWIITDWREKNGRIWNGVCEGGM